MAGKNTITRRVTLEGAEEIRAGLKSLGDAGQRAFRDIQKAATDIKGPGPTFAASMDRIKKSLVSVGNATVDAGKQIRQFGQHMSLIGGVVGAAAVGFGLFVHSAAEAADEFGKSAQRVGVSLDVYSRLQFAFEQAQVPAEALQTSLSQLSRHLVEAKKGGNESAAAFAKLGVKISDSGGNVRPVEAIITDLIGSFSKMKDGAEKTALAMAIFGRSGAQIIPLLNTTKEEMQALLDQADRLGLGFTKAEFLIGQNFNDTLNATGRAFKALSDHIGLIFAPALTAALQAIQDFVARNREAIVGFVQGVVDAFAALPAGVQTSIAVIAGALAAVLFVLGPILIALGVFVQVIGFAIGGLGSLIGVLGAFGTAISTVIEVVGGVALGMGSWVIIIAALVIAIGALAVVVVRNWTQIRASILSALSAVIGAIGAWVGNMTDAAKGVVGVFRSAVASLVRLFGDIIGAASRTASAIAAPFVDAFNTILDTAKSVVADVLRFFAKIIEQASKAARAIVGVGGSGNASVPKLATGGPIDGPGTSTSDSIWMRASRGEFMMKTQAVRKYGVGFMSRLNAMQVPRFAMGGLVASAPGISFSGTPVAQDVDTGPRNTIELHIGGETFRLMASDDVAASLQSFSAGQRVVSTGKPAHWGKRG